MGVAQKHAQTERTLQTTQITQKLQASENQRLLAEWEASRWAAVSPSYLLVETLANVRGMAGDYAAGDVPLPQLVSKHRRMRTLGLILAVIGMLAYISE